MQKRVALITSILVLLAPHLAAKTKSRVELNDLFYGEALYYAYQEDYFSSITRLDAELIQHYQIDEPELDRLSIHRGDAEFSVGDLELSYRMHQRAGRALDRVFSEAVDQNVKNHAAYRMARIFFQKRYFVNTLHALDLIRGDLPKGLSEDVVMLKAQAEMTQRNFSKATELLKPLRKSQRHYGYAAYNLGVAYIRSGDQKRGNDLLNQVGLLSRNTRELIALRDKANLTLGYSLLEQGQALQARPYLERIRLDGAFSNKALLWAGWADIGAKNYENALVPWSILHQRDPTDSAVQEVLLALPFAYSQLEAYGRSALLYGQAINEFNKEIDSLDNSMNSILQGKLLSALGEKEDEHTTSFLNRIKRLPDAPETRYLLELMAGHDFQESVKNYRDLAYLKQNIERWQASIIAYHDLIKGRRTYYEPLLPKIESKFALEDKRMENALKRREFLKKQLAVVQRIRDPKALATSEELALDRKLQKLLMQLNRLKPQPGLQAAKNRLLRLKGVLYWQIDTDYDERLDQAYQNIKSLDAAIERLKKQHQRVVQFKREAYQSFEGYEIPFRRLNTRLNGLKVRITALMAQQGRYLEKRAVLELDKRRQKLQDYQSKARFALAESYDKATRKQEEEAAAEIQRAQENQDNSEGSNNEAVETSNEDAPAEDVSSEKTDKND